MNIKLFKYFCYSAFILLTFVIVWASLNKNVIEGGKIVLEEPWGVATFVDLYISFSLICIFMGYLEKSWGKAIILTVATFLLGSLIPLAYMIFRFNKIKKFFNYEGENIR